VLVVMLAEPSSIEILLERRSARLSRHAGQYALPGGRIDASDSGPEAAAVREAEEETGLDRRAVTVLGRLPDRRTASGWVVTPVVATAHAAVHLVADETEVAELIRLPLGAVCDGSRYRSVVRRQQGLLIRSMALEWEEREVWGATAQVLRSLGRVLGPLAGPWR
jgi:8-oxo-dGTP pyrophosphatase MutT (NUDIX family)